MPRPKTDTQSNTDEREEGTGLVEKLVELKRTSKKTKGGNRFNFTALMVVGDQSGQVGVGTGRARDVASAIKKGVRKARKNLLTIPLVGEANTITHDTKVKYKGAEIMLKPAPSGTGVMAGGAIQIVAEAAGIKNIVGKIIGTDNQRSNLQATLIALKGLKRQDQRKTNLAKVSKSSKKETAKKK